MTMTVERCLLIDSSDFVHPDIANPLYGIQFCDRISDSDNFCFIHSKQSTLIINTSIYVLYVSLCDLKKSRAVQLIHSIFMK